MEKIKFNPSDCPHRRYNPLTGQWILVSPHRSKRPWSGMDEKSSAVTLPSYDPTCYLCPEMSGYQVKKILIILIYMFFKMIFLLYYRNKANSQNINRLYFKRKL